MYRWFLITRYLFSRAIPFAALIVVASSVALLIVIVSVMEGFRGEHKRKIRGTSADISVSSNMYVDLEDPRGVAAKVAGVPGVEAAAPFVETMVLYRFERSDLLASRGKGPLDRGVLKAIDLEGEQAIGDFPGYIDRAMRELKLYEDQPLFRRVPEDFRELFSREWVEKGLWDSLRLTKSAPEDRAAIPPPILVGTQAFYADGFFPGSVVSLTAFSPTLFLPVTREFTVAGYFKTGIYDLDSRGILMSLEQADDFLGLSEEGTMVASGVWVAAAPELRGETELEELRARIEKTLDEAGVYFIKTRTWREERASLLQALRIEKGLTSFILGITVLFGGFMIFIILTVQVVEKTRDLGVLQSMGVTSWGAASVFVGMGAVLCIVGTLIGAVYGVAFAFFVNEIQHWVTLLTGIEVFPLTVFYMDEIPVEFNPYDVVMITVPTVTIGLLASLLPAYRAARKAPADAIRWE